MLPMTASHALSTVFRIFALRTELLNADEIRYVQCGFFRVLRILRSLKIVKYLQHLIAVGGQLVLQRSHVTQVACFSVLAAVLAESLIIFVIFPRHKQSTRRTTSFTFAYGFSLCVALLIVIETRLTFKMSVASVAGDANVVVCARRACHTVGTRLVTDMCYIAPTTFMTCIIYVHFSHCACKVSYHMIMSFHIVVE